MFRVHEMLQMLTIMNNFLPTNMFLTVPEEETEEVEELSVCGG